MRHPEWIERAAKEMADMLPADLQYTKDRLAETFAEIIWKHLEPHKDTSDERGA